MEDHPTAEDFRSLLQQSSTPASRERNALTARHLLAGCEICQSTVRDLPGAQSLLARMFDLPLPGSAPAKPASRYNYDWAFARTERTLAQHLAHGSPSERLPERLTELDRLSEGEQIRRVSAGGRFSDPDFIACLLDRSHAARHQSPRKTLHFALLACLAADACPSERAGGDGALADLQAKAWGDLANARRICGDLLGAEEAFTVALRRYEAGTGSSCEWASLLAKRCSLRIFQRRFDEALDLANEARAIYQALGERHLEASIMALKAITLLYSGEATEPVLLFQQALSMIDQEEDPLLLLVIRHNLFCSYVDIGRPDEALALHVESRDLYQDCKDLLILLRVTWQEGKLLREIGHLHNAEAALIRARQGFADQNLAYETAVISLEIADVYLKLRRFEDMRKTLAEALPIFRSLRVSREVLATLLRLQQAAEEETPGDSSPSPVSAPPLLLFPGTPPREGGPDDL